MSATPEISVLMANCNGSCHLEAAIRSLQDQSFASWELIMVDDASSDDSVALAAKARLRDSRIRIVRQSASRGIAAARNEAIKAARGRWLAIFDSDDMMRPERLRTLYNRARADGALMVADNLLVFSDSTRPRPFLPAALARDARWIGLAEFVDSNRLYSRQPDLGYLKPFINAAMLRELAVAYDERLRIGEDYAFMTELLAYGPRLRLEPAALYLYRRHDASSSRRLCGADIEAMIDADERFLSGTRLLDSDELRALRLRRRSLNSMLLYDRVITTLKAGRYRQAAAMGMKAPQNLAAVDAAPARAHRAPARARKPYRPDDGAPMTKLQEH